MRVGAIVRRVHTASCASKPCPSEVERFAPLAQPSGIGIQLSTNRWRGCSSYAVDHMSIKEKIRRQILRRNMIALQDDSTDIGTHGGASVPAKDPRHMPVVNPTHHHTITSMPTRLISVDYGPTLATIAT